MRKTFTQTDIWLYLCANPLNVKVHIGDLEDMNNQDYIFFDYLTDSPINADDGYTDSVIGVQFSVLTKDFEARKVLVDYIKQMFVCNVSFDHDSEHEYYAAFMRTYLLIRPEPIIPE